jgi:hypothetical protein
MSWKVIVHIGFLERKKGIVEIPVLEILNETIECKQLLDSD